jgi:hypothetical protein
MRKVLTRSAAVVAAVLLHTLPAAAADDAQRQDHDEATRGGPWHFARRRAPRGR